MLLSPDKIYAWKGCYLAVETWSYYVSLQILWRCIEIQYWGKIQRKYPYQNISVNGNPQWRCLTWRKLEVTFHKD